MENFEEKSIRFTYVVKQLLFDKKKLLIKRPSKMSKNFVFRY